jgi:hypothetical protein
MTDAMTDDMTMQSPTNLTDRNVDRIASSPQAFVQQQQGCVGGTAAARGRTTAFLAFVLAGNDRPLAGCRTFRMEHFEGD